MRENDYVFFDERDGVNNFFCNLRWLNGCDYFIDYIDFF